MQALAAHLKRRNQKLLQSQLSLPKIPQIASKQFTKTSIRIRKSKPVIKYVSQTTFSPQQQHIHEQIKFVLHKESTPSPENSRIIDLLKQRQPIRQKAVLPKIQDNHTSFQKQQKSAQKPTENLSVRRKSKSVNSKMLNLDNIFKDRDEFILSYFAEIHARIKR